MLNEKSTRERSAKFPNVGQLLLRFAIRNSNLAIGKCKSPTKHRTCRCLWMVTMGIIKTAITYNGGEALHGRTIALPLMRGCPQKGPSYVLKLINNEGRKRDTTTATNCNISWRPLRWHSPDHYPNEWFANIYMLYRWPEMCLR